MMIKDKRIFLRGLELDDMKEMMPYWNNKEFLDYSGRINTYSEDELKEWIIKTWKARKQRKAYTFGIEYSENRLIIGYIIVKIVNDVSRRADLSIGIFNPEYRGKGLGTESLKLIIDFCFGTLNLLSLELKVFTNNPRAIACYKKLGFREIGIRRRADFVNGEFLDDLMMDLLLEEWKGNILVEDNRG